jgi:phosphohistidine phosphatase
VRVPKVNRLIVVTIKSTARRTRQTLEPLIGALGNPAVELEEDLYAASAEALLDRLHAVPARFSSVMPVGHNPGFQELALRLSKPGKKRAALEAKFPSASLATINPPRHPGEGSPLTAGLTGCSTPSHLPHDSARGGKLKTADHAPFDDRRDR